MTDEERKNLEATANWEIIPKEDFYGIADKVIDDVKFAIKTKMKFLNYWIFGTMN